MARVFRAFDRQTHETVAVKVLTLQLTPDERVLNLAFDREWRSLARLSHLNIVKFLDGGRDPQVGEPYFVLEWVERDLPKALAEAPCANWKEFVELYALPILEGLAHAHEHQVLHRDIKPSNILVTPSRVPKISDFGIAKLTTDIQPGLTLAQHGTKPYQPARGEFTFSRDVYAFGVLVLMSLTGIDPFSSDYATDRYAAIADALDVVQVPDEVRDFLATCVSDEPDDRPADAAVALTTLRSIHEALSPQRPKGPVFYLQLTNRARVDIQEQLDLNDARQVERAIEEDLLEGCAIAPVVRDGVVREGRLDLLGAELKLNLVVDEATADRFVVIGAHSLPSSLLEKLRDRAYSGPMSFRVGEPQDRAAAQSAILELRVAAAEHTNELRLKERADEERRVLWTWKATLRAKEQLEREREAPIRYDDISIEGHRVTFSLEGLPPDDITDEGRHRQVEFLDGGFLGGDIYDVRGTEIDMAVRYGDPSRLARRGTLKVDTWASRSSIMRQSTALDAVIYDRTVRRDLPRLLMKPETAAAPQAVHDVEFVLPGLDEAKKEAVRRALGAADMLAVEGPPGTGKTTFIAELILQVLRRQPDARVLVTSQTHAALDNVLERLAVLDRALRLVRIGRAGDPRISPKVSEYLIEAAVASWRKEVVSRGQRYLRSWAKERRISEREVEIATLYEEAAAFAAAINAHTIEQHRIERELSDLPRERDASETRERGATLQQRIEATSAEIESLKIDQGTVIRRLLAIKAITPRELDGLTADDLKTKAYEAVDREHPAFAECRTLIRLLADWHSRFGRGGEFYGAALIRSQVVAATCLGLHTFKGTDVVEFDLCIVDEASKATATEALVPMVQAKRWVLVGDPKQLPPFVEDTLLRPEVLREHELSENDIRQTLLNRLLQRLPDDCTTFLSRQHRMVPEIGNLISHCFYERKLDSAPRTRPQWLSHALEKPVVWFTTSGEERRYEVNVGTSKANNLEARFIRTLLGRLAFYTEHTRNAQLEVAVLSGYLPQLAMISRQIADARDSWRNLQIECSTIDAFQGRECDVVIYSVTRSNPQRRLGFLREERRLNVALSRGRIGLVLVGDHLFAGAANDVSNPFRCVIDYIEHYTDACALVPVML